MICEAYILAWNEIETIHLTIKHYQKFCDKITILDNYSDDGTPEKAEKMGCDIQYFGIKGQLDDKEYLKIKNSCYFGSKAKYVIVCDSDEILYHPNIKEVLEKESGNIFNVHGWDIFSNKMPKKDFLEIQYGHFQPNYCKKIIFNPRVKINFQYGCHVARPDGRLYPCSETLYLFHYHNIGGFKRVLKRHKLYGGRMSENNKRFGLGFHYLFPDNQQKSEWYGKLEGSMEFSEYNHSGLDPGFIR